MPRESAVWLCAPRLHWATVSELWQRAISRNGLLQPSHADAMLVRGNPSLGPSPSPNAKPELDPHPKPNPSPCLASTMAVCNQPIPVTEPLSNLT